MKAEEYAKTCRVNKNLNNLCLTTRVTARKDRQTEASSCWLTWFSTWNCTTSSMLGTSHTLTLPSSLQVAKCLSSLLKATSFTWVAKMHFIYPLKKTTNQKWPFGQSSDVFNESGTLVMWPLTSRMLLSSNQLMYHRVPATVPTMPMSAVSSKAALTVAPSSIMALSITTFASLHDTQRKSRAMRLPGVSQRHHFLQKKKQTQVRPSEKKHFGTKVQDLRGIITTSKMTLTNDTKCSA